MVEQVEVSGTDCHQVLCPEENQCLILLHQDTALMNLYVKSNPLALALGTLSPPCVHGIKHTRRTALKNARITNLKEQLKTLYPSSRAPCP